MAEQKTYLITGANRGIGKGLTQLLLQRPNTTIIAGVRDPSHSTSKALSDLQKGQGSSLILVPVDSSKQTSAKEAVEILEKTHNVKHIDIVIANAGIAAGGGPVRTTTVENINEHLRVNTIGPVLLFQATAHLLEASPTKQPLFVAISTAIGSMGVMDALTAFPNNHSPYGGSKAALNWFIRRLHFEEPWLTSFVVHPGLVETDMAASVVAGTDYKLKDFGSISVNTSVTDLVSLIDGATREISGTFKNHDGTALPW